MCFGWKMRVLRFICIVGLFVSTGYLIFNDIYQTYQIHLCGLNPGFNNQFIKSKIELKNLINSIEEKHLLNKIHVELEVEEAINMPDINTKLSDKELRVNTMRQQRLQVLFGCKNQTLTMRRMQYGKFWLLRNIFMGSGSRTMGCAETITYTTHSDFTFIDNLHIVVERWLGPISFAVFAPGHDFKITMDAIQYVRNCLPSSELIRKYVSFHVYFPNNHMPQNVPNTEEEILKWPFECMKIPTYTSTSTNRIKTYRALNNLSYPVNVGRNIARQTVNTHLILSCDIELYPSPNFINLFLDMIDRNQTLFNNTISTRVFTMPIFELNDHTIIPNTKKDLRALLKNKTARAFHAHICWYCHKVPEQDKWLEAGNSDKLEVFTIGKRLGKFLLWEPTFVSYNQEPYFDERLTWEAQADRRAQAYAMCLLNYEYYIIHPAFLVHRPGIKRYDSKSPRVAMAKTLQPFLTKTLQPEYRIMYGNTPGCVT